MPANIVELAVRLSNAISDRTAIDKLSDEVPDLDLANSYRVQRVLRAGRIRCAPPAGARLDG
jgi:2-keto-4-pentenoate hydratase